MAKGYPSKSSLGSLLWVFSSGFSPSVPTQWNTADIFKMDLVMNEYYIPVEQCGTSPEDMQVNAEPCCPVRIQITGYGV